MNKILVLGSLSTDFVATTQIRPEVGETVQGDSFFTTFGGKGANQAVAIARLGSNVTMLGKVGDDNFGKEILDNLKNNSVDTSFVEPITHVSSGAALITIADHDNSIIYVPGANGLVNRDYIEKNKDVILSCDLAVAQHEVSEDAIAALAEICSEAEIRFVLNPAPYRPIPKDILDKVTYIIPNESECKLLYPDMSIEEALENNPNKLIVTMGSKGVLYNDGLTNQLISSYKVDVVDTTGAGDTFVGGFSTGLANGFDVGQAIKLGNLAASQSVTKMGAQGGMPILEDLKGDPNYDKNWNL